MQPKMSKLQKLREDHVQNFANFPRKILIEFLIRLSVLDLARASLTCKSWYSIISNSEFVDLHLKYSAKRFGYFYSFDCQYGHFLDSDTIVNNKKADGEKIRMWRLRDGIWPHINSSGGLVAYTIDGFCYVCNPLTREEIKVEMGPFWGENFSTEWCGLGYSMASKQYKILLLARPRTRGAFVPKRVCKSAIYTLGAKSFWREIPGNVPYNVICRPLDFEGSLFFFVNRGCDLNNRTVWVGSFDVESERFRLLSSPDDANMNPLHHQYKRLLSIGGGLAYAEINPVTGVSIGC